MPSATRSRRKQKDTVEEDYYKILEIRKNATAASIKQSYIRLVKLFPPETRPAEFQRIRLAYDTLRDPVKRRKYDITRKYGTTVEGMMEQVKALIMREKWNEATKLLRTITEISPDFIGAYLILARIALYSEDEQGFETEMDRAQKNATNAEEQVSVNLVKFDMLMTDERYECALHVLDETETMHPDHSDTIMEARLHAYLDMGRYDEAYQLADSLIPAPEEDDPEDASLFVLWINVMIHSEQWQHWSKIKSRLRRFMRCAQTDDDKDILLSTFAQEATEWEDAGNYRGALAFTELSLDLSPKDTNLVEQRRRLETMLHLDREMRRLSRDSDIFPLVAINALKWYGEMTDDEDELEELTALEEKEKVSGLLENMKDYHEEIVGGISRLKKKYPRIYRQFQTRWDILYAEHATGLNRETRRRLR